jgi:tRNA (guanine-N7-)-methyltransferase
MVGNSSPIRSAQTGPHADLETVVRRHLDHRFRKPLLDYNRQALIQALAAWRAWNGAAPLILDSGCGVGWSTLQLAREFPECFVLGVDRSEDRLERERRGLGEFPANAALVRADLVDFWRLLLAEGVRPQRHYLLYPNPSPKIGQLQRRWHGHPVFPTLVALGGRLECRSNWDIYMEELALALGWASGLAVAVEAWQPAQPLTPFERKYQASGHALWRCVADLPWQPELVR